MAETTSKVNPTQAAEPSAEQVPTEQATETTEEKKSNRTDFSIKDALYRNEEKEVVTAANEDGVLIAVPKPIKDESGKVIYAGYNTRKHNPLKKDAFLDDVIYLYHQAFVSRVKAAILIKGAEDKEAKAGRMAQFGDEETRKKVQKMARIKEQLAQLEKQLQEDGVDTSQI